MSKVELISKTFGVGSYEELDQEEIIAAVARHGAIKEDNGRLGFIYCVINSLNGDFYIGQTKQNSIEKRFNQHISNSKLRNKNNKFLNAINKYGKENFNIIEIAKIPIENLDYLEIDLISIMNPKYNTSLGGKSTKGFKDKKLTKKHIESLQKHKYYKVYQFNLKGEFIREFNSVKDAKCFLGDCKKYKGISSCLNNKQKSAYGFIWSKKSKINLDKYKISLGKKVAQFNLNDKLLKIWENALQAEKLGGFSSSKISLVCNNKRKTHNKFKWKFYEK